MKSDGKNKKIDKKEGEEKIIIIVEAVRRRDIPIIDMTQEKKSVFTPEDHRNHVQNLHG